MVFGSVVVVLEQRKYAHCRLEVCKFRQPFVVDVGCIRSDFVVRSMLTIANSRSHSGLEPDDLVSLHEALLCDLCNDQHSYPYSWTCDEL